MRRYRPALLHKIITRLMKLLTRRSVLIEEEEGSSYLADADADADANSDEARALRPLQAAACTYRIAFGPRGALLPWMSAHSGCLKSASLGIAPCKVNTFCPAAAEPNLWINVTAPLSASKALKPV